MFHHGIPDQETYNNLLAQHNGQCPYKTWNIHELEPNVRPGDKVTKAGYIIEWTNKHRTYKQLKLFRLQGDELCDNLYNSIKHIKHNDLLDWLINKHNEYDMNIYSDELTTEQHTIVETFISQIYDKPSWINYNAVKRGQHIFLRYAGPCLLAMMNLSLIGGVSAPKINAVLMSTNYLSSIDTAAVFRRLIETTTYVISLMPSPDAIKPGSIGWYNNIAVRLLHSQVRCRLLQPKGSKQWNIDRYGIPINQFDSAVTLLAFSINVLIGIEKLGINLTLQEKQDYIHLWRVCGYYLGVDDSVNPCITYEQAYIDIGSYVMCSIQPDEDSSTSILTNTMLKALRQLYKDTNSIIKPPVFLHAYVARYLLGHYFADQLDIPDTKFTVKQHGLLTYLQYIRIRMYLQLLFIIFKLYGWLGSFELLEHYICQLSFKILSMWSTKHMDDAFVYRFTMHDKYKPDIE